MTHVAIRSSLPDLRMAQNGQELESNQILSNKSQYTEQTGNNNLANTLRATHRDPRYMLLERQNSTCKESHEAAKEGA